MSFYNNCHGIILNHDSIEISVNFYITYIRFSMRRFSAPVEWFFLLIFSLCFLFCFWNLFRIFLNCLKKIWNAKQISLSIKLIIYIFIFTFAHFLSSRKKIYNVKIFLVNICIIKLHPEKVSIKTHRWMLCNIKNKINKNLMLLNVQKYTYVELILYVFFNRTPHFYNITTNVSFRYKSKYI